MSARPGREVPALTDRQRDILALTAQGLPHKEVADRLHLATQTVRNTLAAAYARMDARNAPHAVWLATSRGLIPAAPDATGAP